MSTRTTDKWPTIDAIHYRGIMVGTADFDRLGLLAAETSNGYEESPGRWMAATHKMLPVKFRLHPNYHVGETAAGEPRIFPNNNFSGGLTLEEAKLMHIAVKD